MALESKTSFNKIQRVCAHTHTHTRPNKSGTREIVRFTLTFPPPPKMPFERSGFHFSFQYLLQRKMLSATFRGKKSMEGTMRLYSMLTPWPVNDSLQCPGSGHPIISYILSAATILSLGLLFLEMAAELAAHPLLDGKLLGKPFIPFRYTQDLWMKQI